MSEMNYTSGDQVAKAIDKRIISIAKQVANKSPTNRTVYGKVVAKNIGTFSVSVNNVVYNNVSTFKHLGKINIGDKVACLVPNNQYNDMVILGVPTTDNPYETQALSKVDIINLLYPINSVYMSSIDANPSSMFGGEWQLLGTLSNPAVFLWVRIS